MKKWWGIAMSGIGISATAYFSGRRNALVSGLGLATRIRRTSNIWRGSGKGDGNQLPPVALQCGVP